ncbi:NERD domain-containing protein [Virgibacillus siamensis]|uniref:NERD domain-containing protein n=1 Tax=Virgibacillus siamensis TaxID=480071 RepID=UPI00158E00D9|nr:NERD domain-containing protein [Virgibacillus siamensis]
MPVIQHQRSDYIIKLEALNRRLPATHPAKNKVENRLIREKAGIKGENDMNFYLRFLSPDNHYLHKNPRIPCHGSHFEIDNLLMYCTAFLAVEVKNWYGTIFFDGESQVIQRHDNGTEIGYPNPIPQVKLQIHRLRLLLNRLNIPYIPMHYFIVFSSPKTIIKPLYPDNPVPKEVIHANRLFFLIKKFLQQYSAPILDMKNIADVSAYLVAEHTPKMVDVMYEFGIKPWELIKGVFCPKCGIAPMAWKHGKWHCIQCLHASKMSHISALRDYMLLISDELSNAEARKFLKLDSPDVMKRLLRAAYQVAGTTKNRRYKLSKCRINANYAE